MPSLAEYIWIDGAAPTQHLRCKTRVMEFDTLELDEKKYPEWGFDGSSTYQAEGNFSDLILKPVRVIKDPIRKENNVLVLCEVFNQDNSEHTSNSRVHLRKVLLNGGAEHEPWLGFEQEYTLFSGCTPLGWPDSGDPQPQGPFYCSVGAEKCYGRDVVEEHTRLCLDAGILIYGTNAEVMPGQWEYQVGYRGFRDDFVDALIICDHQILARWLLVRIAEKYNVSINFDNKPVRGDWNGAGCHTNFSTRAMRAPETGLDTINSAITALSKCHQQHIKYYGAGLDSRLTGKHETCSIHDFQSGVADRGSAIRIPAHVHKNACGYLEDRRPGANSDPYIVASCLIATICHVDCDLFIRIEKDNSKDQEYSAA